MKVGMIGTGNMGTILSEALLDGKAVSPSDLIVTNRTKEKAEKLKLSYKGITVVDSPQEVIKQSDLIFLCVKPHDIYSLIEKNQSII